MAKILSLYINAEECICTQACVAECPEVLDGDTPDGIPRIREGAEPYFETHAEQIIMAASACPVNAVGITFDE